MAQLGLRPALVSAVGDDGTGSAMLSQAAAEGIDVSWVARPSGTSTCLIVSVVDGGGWRYLESLPPGTQVSTDDIDRADPALRGAGTVVIQLQQPAPAVLAARRGRQHGCCVVLDGAPSAVATNVYRFG
jgi:ribokinase